MSRQYSVAAHRHWWSLAVVVGIVLVAVGVSIGLLVAPASAPNGLRPTDDPTSVPVSVQQFDDSRAVIVTFVSGPDVPLLLHTSGVVTGLPSSLSVQSGDAILWVDGAPVIGLATSVPLFRSLAVGDKGTDVSALNAELVRLGFSAPSSDTFTAASQAAWVSLQKACGVAKPSQGFDLGAVVWLPSGQVQVRSWTFSLGSPTPGDGVLGVVPGVVSTADVAMADGSSLPSDSRTLTVAGVTVPLPGDGQVVDAGFLAATVTSAQSVSQNGTDFQLQSPGTIQLAQPLTVLALPPVAVFGLSGSSGCVQVGSQAVPVTVVGSSLGVSLVQTADGSSPDEVGVGAGITQTSC